ncbi:MAG: BatA domain-containing protein [Bacteroidia bacterium]|nr:BatA domain-containing protein [Bacteroidia bacterium]
MTFLNPLYLIALAAAAIPIILHLLNLRKSRIIEFSTLTFLKELQRSQIRKLKIKQWLLLALRTLIIVFIVLAFTRPALRSGFGFLPGTAAKSSVIIILDNSFSMMMTDRQGPLLTQAKRKANELIDLLDTGDEAVVLLTTDFRSGAKEFTAAHSALRREVEDTETSFIHGDYERALTEAGALMERSSNFNKEVYIITDRQRSQYAYDAAAQVASVLDKAVRVFVLPLGAEDGNNAAVANVELRSSLFEAGKPVDLRATISNTSEGALTDAVVSVFLNGERVTQNSVSVDAGGRRDVDFTITPREAGWVQGFVELEDDALPEDNRRYFAFSIPEQIRVLIGPSGGRDTRLVSLALNPFVGESEAPQVLNIQSVDRGRLPAENLERYDVLVLTGAEGLPQPFLQRVASWVEQGGSALLFPDADASLGAFSSTLLPLFGIPRPMGLNGSLEDRGSFTTLGSIDFDHPLFRGLFEQRADGRNPEVDSPELGAVVRLRAGERARQVIGTRGGDAFLLDAEHGKGRVLVFGASPDPRWSDFAFKGLFLPLLTRSMYYLASRDDNTVSLMAGESSEISFSSLPGGDDLFELRSPEGGVQRIVPKALPSGLVFSIEAPDAPGVYVLASGNTVLRNIVVNVDARESNLVRASTEEERAFFSRLGIENARTLDQSQSVQQAVTEVRFGVELWKYMIALALLCALAEMLVARDRKRSLPEAHTHAEHLERS